VCPKSMSVDFSVFHFQDDFSSLDDWPSLTDSPFEWVYILQSPDRPYRIKIGKSINLKKRLVSLQAQNPNKLHLLAAAVCPRGTESLWHEAFDDIRSHGEWFYPDGRLIQFVKDLGDCELALSVDSVTDLAKKHGTNNVNAIKRFESLKKLEKFRNAPKFFKQRFKRRSKETAWNIKRSDRELFEEKEIDRHERSGRYRNNAGSTRNTN